MHMMIKWQKLGWLHLGVAKCYYSKLEEVLLAFDLILMQAP